MTAMTSDEQRLLAQSRELLDHDLLTDLAQRSYDRPALLGASTARPAYPRSDAKLSDYKGPHSARDAAKTSNSADARINALVDPPSGQNAGGCKHESGVVSSFNLARGNGKDTMDTFEKTISGFEQTSDAKSTGMRSGSNVGVGVGVAPDTRTRQEIVPKPPDIHTVGGGGVPPHYTHTHRPQRSSIDKGEICKKKEGSLARNSTGSSVLPRQKDPEALAQATRTFTNYTLQVPGNEWLRRRSHCSSGDAMPLPSMPKKSRDSARGARETVIADTQHDTHVQTPLPHHSGTRGLGSRGAEPNDVEAVHGQSLGAYFKRIFIDKRESDWRRLDDLFNGGSSTALFALTEPRHQLLSGATGTYPRASLSEADGGKKAEEAAEEAEAAAQRHRLSSRIPHKANNTNKDAIDAFEHRLSLRHSPYSSIPLNTSRSLFDEPELTPRDLLPPMYDTETLQHLPVFPLTYATTSSLSRESKQESSMAFARTHAAGAPGVAASTSVHDLDSAAHSSRPQWHRERKTVLDKKWRDGEVREAEGGLSRSQGRSSVLDQGASGRRREEPAGTEASKLPRGTFAFSFLRGGIYFKEDP